MSKRLWWLIGGLLLTGVCGFSIGLVGDLGGWWVGLGFTSNVLAGATGACFGIPFAVIVIQTVVRENEGRKLSERIKRTANETISALNDVFPEEIFRSHGFQAACEEMGVTDYTPSETSPQRVGGVLSRIKTRNHDRHIRFHFPRDVADCDSLNRAVEGLRVLSDVLLPLAEEEIGTPYPREAVNKARRNLAPYLDDDERFSPFQDLKVFKEAVSRVQRSPRVALSQESEAFCTAFFALVKHARAFDQAINGLREIAQTKEQSGRR